VLPLGDTTPLPPAPDVKPPTDVRNLKAKAGDRLVALTWDKPLENDVRSFVVTRSVNQGTRTLSDTGTTIYQGAGTKFTDRRLTNGIEYRYTVVAIDGAGNRSPGAVITATPKRNPLRAPTDGKQLQLRRKTRVIMLDWDNAPNANYYNLQLFSGTTKILSAWPTTSAYKLHRSWKYLGHAYRLKPGLYHWYVWPGFGARSAVNYGTMLGSATFVIKP